LAANTLVGSSMAQLLQAHNPVPATVGGKITAKGFHGHLVKKKRHKANACPA
jgi:hypothetical protein